MKKFIAIIMLLTACLLEGCTARLSINMAILDRTYLLNSPSYWIEKVRPLEIKARENLLSGHYLSLSDKAKNETKKSIRQIATKINAPKAIIENQISQQKSTRDGLQQNYAMLSDSVNMIAARIGKLSRRNVTQKNNLEKTRKKYQLQADSLRQLIAGYETRIKNDSVRRDGLTSIPDFTVNKLIGDMEKIVDREVNDVIKMHKLALSKHDHVILLPLCKNKAVAECDTMQLVVDSLRSSFALASNGFIKLKGLGPYLAVEIKNLGSFLLLNDSTTTNKVLRDLEADIIEKTRPLANVTTLQSIQNDPLASIVAGASKNYWKAKTNLVRGFTSIGNSDIAAVTQPNGEYTIKGVRNDASEATKATFAFTSLTIEALAKYSGVVLPDKESTGDNTDTDTLTTISGKIIKANSSLKRLNAKSEASKLNIFSSILNAESSMGDADKRKLAIEQIQLIFEENKKTLLNQ